MHEIVIHIVYLEWALLSVQGRLEKKAQIWKMESIFVNLHMVI